MRRRTSAGSRRTSAPATSASPASAGSSVVRMRRVVVLPPPSPASSSRSSPAAPVAPLARSCASARCALPPAPVSGSRLAWGCSVVHVAGGPSAVWRAVWRSRGQVAPVGCLAWTGPASAGGSGCRVPVPCGLFWPGWFAGFTRCVLGRAVRVPPPLSGAAGGGGHVPIQLAVLGGGAVRIGGLARYRVWRAGTRSSPSSPGGWGPAAGSTASSAPGLAGSGGGGVARAWAGWRGRRPLRPRRGWCGPRWHWDVVVASAPATAAADHDLAAPAAGGGLDADC